jgi:hypothetical protein
MQEEYDFSLLIFISLLLVLVLAVARIRSQGLSSSAVVVRVPADRRATYESTSASGRT